MNKIAIMQPYFFPYIGYWQLINAVDIFVIYDDVNYIKGGWINRNNILLNGKAHLITLPLQQVSQWRLINEISVTSDVKKINALLKTILLAYKKAPFFTSAYPLIEDIVKSDGTISSIVAKSINLICEYLGITTKILISSDINKNNELKGQEKIIDICEKLEATHYINPIGGMNLYNKEDFKKRNIDLYFINAEIIPYKQFQNNFVPNLSIIDALMFNDKEQLKKIINSYSLL